VTGTFLRPGVRNAGVVAAARTPGVAWGFAEAFIVGQTLLPALLYLPGTQGIRLWLRVAPFLLSLAALAWWLLREHEERRAHPASAWIVGVLSLLTIMLFHPLTPSLTGGLAHLAVYFAVIAPVFWAPLLVRTPEQMARILALILICSGVNAAVGVLQVYDPARWMPPEFSRVLTEGAYGLGTMMYIGPDGRMIIRPPGLFDTPGAVAGPGMFAALLGAVFGLSALPLWQRAGAFAFAAAGVAAIYLSQVRVSLVVLVVMALVYGFVLLRQGRAGKAATFGLLAAGVLSSAFMLAVALGGRSVADRVYSLFAADPFDVYYAARGVQLDYTMTELIFHYPLGAGLGRWGMAAGYFGTGNIPGIWAELQFTGWLIDGGLAMIALYLGAIVIASRQQLLLAGYTAYPRVAACAAVVCAANLGIAIMTLSFTPFMTQIGIQYWFLAGALHGLVRHMRLPDP
jgi:hypothetical protein